MPRLAKSDLAAKVKRCIRAHELGKRHYETSDSLLQELSLILEPGEVIEVNEKPYQFVDRWAGKNIVWTPCAARRYELSANVKAPA